MTNSALEFAIERHNNGALSVIGWVILFLSKLSAVLSVLTGTLSFLPLGLTAQQVGLQSFAPSATEKWHPRGFIPSLS